MELPLALTAHDVLTDPLVLSLLAPVVTALIKALAGIANARLPDWAKGLLTGTAGIVLATASGGTPVEGLAGALAANKVRDQLFGSLPAAAPTEPVAAPPHSSSARRDQPR